MTDGIFGDCIDTAMAVAGGNNVGLVLSVIVMCS